MAKKNIGDPKSCSILKFLSVLGGKWKILILYILSQGKTHYGKLLFIIPDISGKVLSQNLKQLETSEFITKHPKDDDGKVYYSLTQKSISLFPILHDISHWTKKMYPEDNFEDCYINNVIEDE